MTQPDGIDMKRSGWNNPEGFERAPRPSTPAPVVQACEDQGPDGWTCDLKPGHIPAENHWADTGIPGGLRWTRSVHDVSTIGDLALPEDQRPTLQGGIIETVHGPIQEIAFMAEKALGSTSPAAWAVALDKILEVARNAR